MLDTAAIRKIFPHTQKLVYFNSASNGPLPDPAYQLMKARLQEARTATIGAQKEIFDSLANIRRNGAEILGCRPREAGFGFNTTFGINLAAAGLPLDKGDEVLLSDIEFPANVYPWLELRNRGIEVKFVKSRDGFFDLELLVQAITKRTRVISLSFVQYFNGYKIDLKTVGEICRERNIFLVVDAMQGAGAESMEMSKWNAALAAAGGQKWLLGSQGSGLFYVAEEVQKILTPPWRSWLSINWQCNWAELKDYSRKYDNSAGQYEMGTYPAPQVHSLDWTLNFLVQQGIENIQQHNHELLDRLIEYLQGEPFYRITSSLEKEHRSSILSFTSDKGDIGKIHQRLTRQNIITALREGSIRISVHLYNNMEEIGELIAALGKAARSLEGDH